MAPTNVYLLPLTDDGAPDVPGRYIYLPPPTTPPYLVRFVIEGTSSICKEGNLWVNIPEKGKAFNRKQYKQFKLTPDFNKAITFDIPIYTAGAFDWYTTYTPLPEYSASGDVDAPLAAQTDTYYLDVCPRLSIQGQQLPLNALSLFSTISKFMGKYPTDWNAHLTGIANRGYNMVHFTPLNVRGDSNSPYSIADQHAFDPDFFPNGETDVQDLVAKMEKEHGLLSMTDIVWNHTANNSKWLEEYPAAGYSVKTAPHLEPALLLDNALLSFSDEMEKLGYPTELKSTKDLQKVMEGIKEHVIAKIKLWEFYVVDVEKDTKAVVDAWLRGKVDYSAGPYNPGIHGLQQVKDLSYSAKVEFVLDRVIEGSERMGERYRRKADPESGALLLAVLLGPYDKRTQDAADERVAYGTIHKFLEECNLQYYKEYDADCAAIMEQLYNRIKYVRIDDHGPKEGPITKNSRLVESYFTRLPRNSTTSKHGETSLDLVNNGWIWAADVMKDNAGPESKAYLRREVISWGDCVKLRYGTKRADNPWLWDFQAEYTRLMAKYFHGFRIDNCHSTPLPLAQYMLDEARKVRPDLVCVAELFSGDEKMDFKYVEQLGLSCLIREAMQAWETREMSRLVHRHAGVPIGSFDRDAVINVEAKVHDAATNGSSSAPASSEVIRTIKESPVHALFMDCTHDNETPAQKRDARDTLPNAALVAMCACATGSVFGYDEVYPRLIELVHETRQYTSPYSIPQVSQAAVKSKAMQMAGEGGIGGIKKFMNEIHVLMGQDGYDETFIHHDHEYITIHRVHPQSRKGYFLIAHTAFPGCGQGNGGFPPVYLPGTKANALGAWMLEVDTKAETVKATIADDKLHGLPSRVIELKDVTIEWKDNQTTITVGETFPPGSIAVFETFIPGAERSESLDQFITSGGSEACKDLSFADLNFLLYRCDPEERQSSGGKDGVYEIPGHGKLVYAGLQGWWSVLKDVVEKNNLGHPICQHLRDGAWALDYCVGRLERASHQECWAKLSKPAAWLKERCDAIRQVPSFMLPRYFAMVIQSLYCAGADRAMELMTPNVKGGQKFLQELAVVSVQVIGYMDNASLWPDKLVPSASAGLPHFSSDWARCWGRDIMISLRGLMIATGRWEDAKEHIFAFASVLNHGTVPNLLGSGKSPRYNSRDSVWFFLQCIQDYTKLAPDGLAILKEKVRRRFLPYDEAWFEYTDPKAYSVQSTVEDVIQEALQQHASGQKFREHNAGPNLDSQMKDNGFNLEYGVNWENGMVFGGNQDNCGTWMDKMGESEKGKMVSSVKLKWC
jgi:glycogen debranching enzyme